MPRAILMLTHVHQMSTLLTKQQRYQSHESFRRIQKNKYRDPETETGVLVKTVNHVKSHPSQMNEALTKNGEKQDQRGIPKSRARDVLKSTVKIESR